MDFSQLETTAQRVARETAANDDRRREQRQKQIDYGKNTLGYQNYIEAVPREARRVNGKTLVDPVTPDVNQICSKRSFDGQMKKWRRQLHLWDPSEDDGDQAIPVAAYPTGRNAEPSEEPILASTSNPPYGASRNPDSVLQPSPSQNRGSGGVRTTPSKGNGSKRCFDEVMPDADGGSRLDGQSSKSRRTGHAPMDLASDASYDAWNVREPEVKTEVKEEPLQGPKIGQQKAEPKEEPLTGSIYDDCELGPGEYELAGTS